MIVDQGAVQYVNKQTNKLIQHNRLQTKTTQISYDSNLEKIDMF